MLRLTLIALLGLLGCDDDGAEAEEADAGLGIEGVAETFELMDGETLSAGESGPCAAGFGEASDAPADWPRLHVLASAPPGGDGSEDAPFADLQDALEAAGEAAVVLRLGAGEYAGPLRSEHGLALVGQCAGATTVSGGVRVSGGDLYLEALTVDGGENNALAEDGGRLIVRRARLLNAAVVGLRAHRVAAVALIDSTVQGAGERQVTATECALVIRRSVVGPGPGPGVLVHPSEGGPPQSADGPEAACPDGAGPACPYAALLFIDTSLIRGVGTAGVFAQHSQARIHRSRVEDTASEGGGASGVLFVSSFGVIDGGSVITGSAGAGVVYSGSRGALTDSQVELNSGGGLTVERLAADDSDLLVPGGTWHPVCEYMPMPPDALFEGSGWETPRDFFGERALRPMAELPPELRREDPARVPEAALHEWARLDVTDVTFEGNDGHGVRLSGHAARLAGVSVTGTLGEASAALRIEQVGSVPLDAPGASTVALSVVEEVALTGNEGVGLYASGAWLYATADSPEGPISAPMPFWAESVGLARDASALQISDLSVTGGRFGAAVIDSTVRASGLRMSEVGGVGLMSAGAVLRATDLEVAGVRALQTAARGGAMVDDASDGLVMMGSSRFSGGGVDGLVDIQGLTVTGAARVGVLVVNDEHPFGGTLNLADGRLADNGLDAAALGDPAGVQVEGFELAGRDAADLPPAALP